MKKNPRDWQVLELARTWCMIAGAIDADAELAPADKLAHAQDTVRKAVACLEQGRAGGAFTVPERVRWFATSPDFAPVRGKFDPQKK